MENETKTIATVAQLDTAFSTLIAQREAWEAGTYAASNAELYALLGRCLDVFYKVKRYTELARGLNGLLEKRGFKFTSGTSLEVKLLRAVFGDPTDPGKFKNRIYGYARVLSVAFAAKITGEGLPEFVNEQGGIDEIRRHDAKAAVKKNQAKVQRQLAEAELIEPDFAPIATGITITAELEPEADQHFSIALLRKEQDGTGSIVFGTNNASLVGSVLGIAGRIFDEKEQEERKRKKEKEFQQKKNAEIKSLAEELYPEASVANAAVTEPTDAENAPA